MKTYAMKEGQKKKSSFSERETNATVKRETRKYTDPGFPL
jgi:hypothetical protein